MILFIILGIAGWLALGWLGSWLFLAMLAKYGPRTASDIWAARFFMFFGPVWAVVALGFRFAQWSGWRHVGPSWWPK